MRATTAVVKLYGRSVGFLKLSGKGTYFQRLLKHYF
jgi:hypothetical protein